MNKTADVMFTSRDRVREVSHNFNADGFEALYPKEKGGQPKIFTLPERRKKAVARKAFGAFNVIMMRTAYGHTPQKCARIALTHHEAGRKLMQLIIDRYIDDAGRRMVGPGVGAASPTVPRCAPSTVDRA